MKLFLCGDVMTGRGIDQVLPHPGDPRLYESYLKSAEGYVRLAEQSGAVIPKPVDFPYIWGDALSELQREAPDFRVINLETAVTRGGGPWPGKGIHYRMNPDNLPCITSAGIDLCGLANNHVLDWGTSGLEETLRTLRSAGLRYAGAGMDAAEARAPAVLDAGERGRVLVFAFGEPGSGIPASWAATDDRPGVYRIDRLSEEAARRVGSLVRQEKRPRDIAVASVHWGGNWGFEIPPDQRRFAHALIDAAGIDLIHGHSSHHVKGIEVYRHRPILYGIGDFLNDYEGIGGNSIYRPDLTLMAFPELNPDTGELLRLKMSPMRIRHLRLNRASTVEASGLRDILDREGRALGTRAAVDPDGTLRLVWMPDAAG